MANVDLITKRIRGAEPNTRTYYHELGYLYFEDNCNWGNTIRVWQDLSTKGLLFTLGLNALYPLLLFKLFIIVFLLGNIYSEMYEENWCNKYARTKFKGDGEKDAKRTKTRKVS